MTYEGLRLKFRNHVYIPLTRKRKAAELTQKSFTIISNNCWGGTVYEAYNLEKQSPTVGLFFMATDYIRFLSDLPHYLAQPLRFITPEQSKYKEELKQNSNWGTYPLAVLDDVEVHLLHYPGDEAQIRAKWNRRVQRIDWEYLIVKFNDQNGCVQENIDDFFKLPYKNKLFFTSQYNADNARKYGEAYVFVRQPGNQKHILASYEPIKNTKGLDLTAYLNALKK